MIERSCRCLRRLLFSRVACVTLIAMAAFAVTAPVRAQSTLVVDLDGKGTATNCNAGTPAYSSIQAAINAAAPGDTIFVCPGTYDEQLTVTKNNLAIRGSGAGSTILRPGTVMVTAMSIVTPIPVPVQPIVLVEGASGVTLAGLTIDGSAHDSGGAQYNCGFTGHFIGVYYRNASGTVDRLHVTNMRSATVCSFGVRIESSPDFSANVLATRNIVDQYGDYGIICAGLKTSCTITGNTVRGRGQVDDQIQAGIAVRVGALAAISGNTITDHYYLPRGSVGAIAVGIFLVYVRPDTNPHLLRDNIFASNELNVQRVSTAEVID